MADILNAHAQNFGDRPAVIDDRPDGNVLTITYAELDNYTNQLGHLLVGHGVKPGDRVVWCGQNSIGVAAVMSAARKIGATAVPLNYRLSDDEAAYVIDHCDAEIVYVDADFAPMLERVRESIPKIREVLVFDGELPTTDSWFVSVDGELMSMPTSSPPEPPAETADGATMIYTSGTTGKPKGAFRQRATDPTQMLAMLEHIGYEIDDTYLTTGPLYHSGPAGFMSIAVSMGQTVVVQRKFNAEDWLRLVDKYRCSSTFSAPTPIRMICNLPDETIANYDVSSMRVMIANAAPWSFALKQQYLSHFPAHSLFEVYGSTELGVNTILRPEDQL
ncbi:MAG: AMP-binding protein, partial [Actinomycetota bacterium]|nr:AMP-binding protein [Actinomycetota bacterium]